MARNVTAARHRVLGIRTALVLASALTLAARLTGQDAVPTESGVKIIILKPQIRFEDVGGADPKAQAADSDYARRLSEAATRAVGGKATFLDLDKLAPPETEICRKLDASASRLARGEANEEAIADLAGLAALNEHYLVLIQFLRLKTGPGASWNPYTGGITSSIASTLVQVALVSAKTARIVWKGERLVRNKALTPTSPEFGKALALVYHDFDIR